MAAPITHIVLTNKIFNKYFSNKEKGDFFIGASFPDIRYLKVIKREKTHFNNITLNEIKLEQSFFSGLKFHSLLDEAREKFIIAKDIYSLCPKSEYITIALKFIEDEALYNYINNWNDFIVFFNKILPEENLFGINKKDIKKWHIILQEYFFKQPTNDSIKKFVGKLGFSNHAINEINLNIHLIKSNKKVIKIINELYDNFELLLIEST